MIEVSDNELAYTAGIVDGEGCIGIYETKRSGRVAGLYSVVTVTNTNLILLDWLVSRFGGTYNIHNRVEGQKTSFVWRLYSRQAANFIEQILPHLRLKWEQAEIVLKLESMKYSRNDKHGFRDLSSCEWTARYALKDAMNVLNKRGTDTITMAKQHNG